MGLRHLASKLFGRAERYAHGAYFYGTTTPEGIVHHERYGEAPWETWVDRWTTSGHPIRLIAEKNGMGSYDIIRHMKDYDDKKVRSYVSLETAVSYMIKDEARIMNKFGGKEVNYLELREKVLFGTYATNHLFSFLQHEPHIFEKWMEGQCKDYVAKTDIELQDEKIQRAINAVAKSKGKMGSFSKEAVLQHISQHRFPEGHVFQQIKDCPSILDDFIARKIQKQNAQKPAAKPAP